MGHRIHRGESGHLRHRRARTQDEEHAFAEDPSTAAIVQSDLNGFGSDEPALADDPPWPSSTRDTYPPLRSPERGFRTVQRSTFTSFGTVSFESARRSCCVHSFG